MGPKKRKPSNSSVASASAAAGSGGGNVKKRMRMTKKEVEEKKHIGPAETTRLFVDYCLGKIDLPPRDVLWKSDALNIDVTMTFDLASQGLGDRMNVFHIIAETHSENEQTLATKEICEYVKGAWAAGGKAVINHPDSRGLRPIDIKELSPTFLDAVTECDLKDGQPVVDWSVNKPLSRFGFLEAVKMAPFPSGQSLRTIMSRLSPESWDLHNIYEGRVLRSENSLLSTAIGVIAQKRPVSINQRVFNEPETKQLLIERSTDHGLKHALDVCVLFQQNTPQSETLVSFFGPTSFWDGMHTWITTEQKSRLKKCLGEWNRSTDNGYLLHDLILIVADYYL